MENKKPRTWLKVLILVLCAEKFIQHIFVTFAFYMNLENIRATVVPDYRVLMLAGGIVAILFAIAFWLVYKNNPRGAWLVIFLALFDIVGEFVAQGTFAIAIPLSFVVAVILLIAGITYSRQTTFQKAFGRG